MEMENVYLIDSTSPEIETLETETVSSTGSVDTIDYSQQLIDINVSLISIIFFFGILSGLLTGKIMWNRVK